MQYEQINEKISEELNANNKKINELSNKIKVFSIDGLDNKLMVFLAFCMINYFTGVLLMTVFSDSIISLVQNGIIQYHWLSVLNMAIPSVTGIVGLKWYEKKTNLKKRLSKVTSSKSRCDKFREQIRFEIELEKLVNRNNILNNINLKQVEEQIMLDKLSSNYSFVNKDIINNNQIPNYSILYNKYKDMDLLVIKKFLIERFWKVRSKGQKILEFIVFGGTCGLLLTIYWNVPTMFINGFSDELVISANIVDLFVNMWIPFLLGGIGTGLYVNRNYNIREQVFDILNKELLNNQAIDKKCSVNDDVVEKKLIDSVNDIVDYRLEIFRRDNSNDSKFQKETSCYAYKFDLEKNMKNYNSLEILEECVVDEKDVVKRVKKRKS